MKNYKYAVSLHHIYPISAEFNESGSDLMLTFNYKALLTDGQIAEIKLSEKVTPLHLNGKTLYSGNNRQSCTRVQWIDYRISVPTMWVRFPPGVLTQKTVN